MEHQFEISIRTFMQDDTGIYKYFALVPDGEDDFLVLFQSIEGHKDKMRMSNQLHSEMIAIHSLWSNFTTIH